MQINSIDEFLKEFEPLDFPKLGYIRLPKFELTEEDKKEYSLQKDISSEDLLHHLVEYFYKLKKEKGLIPLDKEDIYRARIKEEMDIFKKLYFVDYILLIFSILKFCQNKNIMNSPSRGSCGGSLVLYVIGVTSLDPIKHGLLFERFVSAARTEIKELDGKLYIASSFLPDVDIDSDTSYKPLINEYLNQRFAHKTCRMLNLNHMKSRLLIKEVGKIVGGKSEVEMNTISSLIPTSFGIPKELSKAYEEIKELKEWCDKNKESYEIALALQELIKNKSVHASGIFISENRLDETLPTELTKDKEKVTSFDMKSCEKLGIKVDNLGLKNLAAIAHCLKLVGQELHTVDVNHPSVYTYLNNSTNYHGVFQCEEGSGKDILYKSKPKNIDEIAVAIALNRPGCIKFVDRYIENKLSGNYKIEPRVKDILEPTFGVIIFQEQIIKLCIRMAGFTPQQADGVRKAVGKKNMDKVLEYKPKFIEGALKNEFAKELTEEIWQVFEDSGNYLFNASHAVGYAYLTAITAYLKANYPKEFFLSLFIHSENEQSQIEEISKIYSELKDFNIKLLPPNLLKSQSSFSIENGNIRFGLSAIKGNGKEAVEKLNDFRSVYSNKFELFQAAEEAGLSKGIVCALIQAGALSDSLDQGRSLVVLEAQLWKILSDREKKIAMQLGQSYNFDLCSIIKQMKVMTNEKGKPLIKESRYETIKTDADPYFKIYNKNKRNEQFANWFYETSLLGYSYYNSLKNVFKDQFPTLQSIEEVIAEAPEKDVFFTGIVQETVNAVAKNEKKTRYFKASIKDEHNKIDVLLFNFYIDRCKEENLKLPEEGNIVIVEGTKKKDAVFADKIIIQDYKIYMKLSDIKKDEDSKKTLEKTPN